MLVNILLKHITPVKGIRPTILLSGLKRKNIIRWLPGKGADDESLGYLGDANKMAYESTPYQCEAEIPETNIYHYCA